MRSQKSRMASGVFRYGGFVSPEEGKVLFYRDGKTATIAVIDVNKDGLLQFGEIRIGSEDEALANACIVPPGGTGISGEGVGSGGTGAPVMIAIASPSPTARSLTRGMRRARGVAAPPRSAELGSR